ncbi:MAG: hypothetical protein RIA69_19175 [Cyclobacteriaceae bacterium]
MQAKLKTNSFILYVVMLVSITTIGLQIERHHSTILFLAFFSAFFSYCWLIIYPSSSDIYVGVLIRLVLFAGMPSLSDDLYRFIWDGHLLNAGINPFAELPGYYLSQPHIEGISESLYAQLNSTNYFTIYPPLNQFVFWLAANIGANDWLLSANIIRLFLLFGDFLAVFFLRKILAENGQEKEKAMIYFLNPLVILEGVGNLHFEVLVTAFLMVGIYYLTRKKWLSALGFGLAIGTKLLPLIYLPGLFFHGKIKKRIGLISLICLISAITFLPMLNIEFITGMKESLGLYFKKFEFNASIYFIIRQFGFWVKGYNIIGTLGPFLSVLTALIIIATSYFQAIRSQHIAVIMFVALMIYLSFSTIVHPWYIIPLIALGVIINAKTALAWSFFIFLTYFGYKKEGFELSMYWVVLEYLVVFSVFIYEFVIEKSRIRWY